MGDYVKSQLTSGVLFFLLFPFFRWFRIKEPGEGAVVSSSIAPFSVRVLPCFFLLK